MKDNCKLLYVYSDGCGYCNEFNPVWNEFVTTFKNKFGNVLSLKKINSQEGGSQLEKLEINGVPTILFLNDKNEKIEEFNNERTVDNLISFCNNNLIKVKKTQLGGSKINKVNEVDFTFLIHPKTNKKISIFSKEGVSLLKYYVKYNKKN
tara:strand:+ start:1279 stop:1728 length:450 start_codon:yes stop_codon:yes gene_type:complete